MAMGVAFYLMGMTERLGPKYFMQGYWNRSAMTLAHELDTALTRNPLEWFQSMPHGASPHALAGGYSDFAPEPLGSPSGELAGGSIAMEAWLASMSAAQRAAPTEDWVSC